MKQLLLILLLVCFVQSADAQSARRRAEQQAARKSNADNMSVRAQLSFPTSDKMSEDVVWRRDIYREINLTDDANAGLYYPVEPVGSQVNLFTYIFKLFMTGNIRAYEYRLDGNENFEDSSAVKRMAFLDNYHIYYERTNGQVHIDNSDIPSREVTAYYVKESAYYDQSTATFHTKVLALCPIMKREDDFGDGATPYPLFWVRYDDLAPFLAKQTIMTSNLNNAATMSVDDYFTKNMYRGKIYKTTNMLGRTLAQYCTTDSAMTKEQKRIEKEISDFETNMWGDKLRKDSLDSIAKLDKKSLKAVKENRRSSGIAPKTVRTNRRSSGSSSSSSSSPRVTVRRERH
ncbi:gliding motility-associated protein GldN [Hoylesella oralis ATCC 33269]|uniref:Gliding motility-associated protein GldN n=1 Tax=Hoylesella oralis ATCC 33269 TaxID=873533 RepID=E7RQ97_9BACT|nr:gliding motility protein GldN [Hoylesella oralis]EFZ36435.1 gliding motility-associated protein GldN [Hoylesella oralis ATCC 33269]EPH18100.1 gliding motility associated protein GldN [Hoylesella oralis HGA0225]SHF94777.1 gliding motility associated protien GldN [Hoylesella oralis]